MNQDLVFLTDGGDNLHALVDGFSPCTEHYLDWFHVTMPLTVLGQYAKGPRRRGRPGDPGPA
jgi:hypothetical protein